MGTVDITAESIAQAFATAPHGYVRVRHSIIAGEPWSSFVATVVSVDGDTVAYTSDGMWHSRATRSEIVAWELIDTPPACDHWECALIGPACTLDTDDTPAPRGPHTLPEPAPQPEPAPTRKPYRRPRAASYVVLPHGGYADTADDYGYAATRADVARFLVDYGWIDNPGVFVYRVMPGQIPADVVADLCANPDPYPDYVVQRGTRGGVQWIDA